MYIRRLGSPENPIRTYEINYNYFMFNSLIWWIWKNPDVRKLRILDFWPLTDDLVFKFTFMGHQFLVETPFVDYWLSNKNADCPVEVTQKLIAYIRSRRMRGFERRIIYYALLEERGRKTPWNTYITVIFLIFIFLSFYFMMRACHT